MKNATLEWDVDRRQLFCNGRLVGRLHHSSGINKWSAFANENRIYNPKIGYHFDTQAEAVNAVERHFGIEGGKPNATEVG